jgi:hypothetical protein
MTTTETKIPLTKRALIQRVNRKLKGQHKRMQCVAAIVGGGLIWAITTSSISAET